MSAITGIFYRDGRKVDPELIKKMNDRLSHRGHDGSAVWCDGPVALGHQMLWTTPESLHEKLPFEESGLVITADARIDNRKELSEELYIEDKENVSDSYFILKAYEKWGEDCPDKLLGDFAFAIWDENEEKLFCARDHMGVKPFYYYLSDDGFFFATEIKAILSIPIVPNKLNEKKLALFLMRDILDQELTFYENIKSLPAAHSFTLKKHKITKKKYWELDPNLQITMDSEEDYGKAFRDIFAEAVRCRLRSHYPIGFELSGGLDSSSIVCMAQKIFSENKNANLKAITTFSTIYDAIPECDERYYIKKIIDTGKIEPTFINGDNISPLENIDTILWYQDQPFFSPHMANQIKLYQKMHDKDIRVLFSGEGGDQIVSHGSNYIMELAVTLKWKKLREELNGLSHNFNVNKYKILLERVIFPLIPYHLKKWINLFLRKDMDSILNKDFLKKLGMEKVDYNITFNHLKKITSKKYHYFTINSPLNQTIFGIMDRGIANFNIEERYPFFDKRIVEFCYALPTEMKLKYGWNRYILRLAMETILPSEIQWRSQKANLGAIYKRNLILFEKNTLEKIIFDDNKIIKDYVDLEKLQDIFKKNKSEKRQNLFDMWLVILLYLWLKYSRTK